MTPLARILVFALCIQACADAPSSPVALRDGDIVFQTSRSAQSQAIQAATHSAWSHMGMILVRDGRPFVFEAIACVQLTPLDEWVRRGEGGRYVAKRLRDQALLADPAKAGALRKAAMAFEGRAYDPYFEWSDDRIYCSELVWKAYDRGLGVKLGALATLGSFDLTSAVVKAKLAERYGDHVPAGEQVISPAAVFASPLLEEAR